MGLGAAIPLQPEPGAPLAPSALLETKLRISLDAPPPARTGLGSPGLPADRLPSHLDGNPPGDSTIAAALLKSEIFSQACARARGIVAANTTIATFNPGEEYSLQPGAAGEFAVVLEGSLCLRHAEGPPAVIGPGQSHGEYSWMAESGIHLHAATSTRVALICRSILEQVLAEYPELRAPIAVAIDARLNRQRLRSAILDEHLLGPLSEQLRHDLAGALVPVLLHGGEPLFLEGDELDGFYLIIDGRLRVVGRNGEGQETTIAELGRGEPVGEMALFTGGRRTASVWAIRDTRLGHLSPDAFTHLLERHPGELIRLLGGRLAHRLQLANRGRTAESTALHSLAVVPAHRGAPTHGLCHGLAQALGQFGSVRVISSAWLGAQLGDRDLAHTPLTGNSPRITDILAKLEHHHDFLIFETDDQTTPWTELCLRQCDQILIAGEASADPRPGETESRLLANFSAHTSKNASLVLIHPDGTAPHSTRAWLRLRNIQRTYHVRGDSPADIARLARMLTNRACGLALGGGFARGLAHLGVLQAFEASGISVDAIGGSSMGAVVGGLWAQGWSVEKIIHEVRSGCLEATRNFTFPFTSFHRGGKFSKLIASFFADRQIEDLPIPYFCVSANLNRAQVKMHTEGELTRAVLASTRAPGVFPPIVYDGELHVDGGVINNVPVDLMKPFVHDGVVIGVDISPPHEISDCDDYGYDVSGWNALRSRFGIFGVKRNYYPSILLVLMRTLEFGGIAFKSTRNQLADIYLQPPMLGFKRTDWHLAEKIVEVSREHALEQIAIWQQSARAKHLYGHPAGL
jgi:predicted acylesterase/phospholipase RssA/CRP-like cAMP-binding protein